MDWGRDSGDELEARVERNKQALAKAARAAATTATTAATTADYAWVNPVP